MIDGVSQVSLNVSVSDQTMGSERRITVTPPDRSVVLVLGGPYERLAEFNRHVPDQLPSSPVFFTCRNVVATYEELMARGVRFVQAPVKMPFGWWALFCDPDANRFALNQRAK